MRHWPHEDKSDKDFLICEYTSISDHFRSYQTNRLNIMVLSVPVVGAIMLNCYGRGAMTQALSVLILYLLLILLIKLDHVFMKRLRNYTIRLACIEKEFEVVGYSRQRLKQFKESHQDATTRVFRIIIHLLNISIACYALAIVQELYNTSHIYSKTVDNRNITIIPSLSVVNITVLIYWFTYKKLDTRILKNSKIYKH